jgi:hypothetical protein
MRLRLHPLYKNLLILAIVVGPIVWLVLTEDGQRRTDLVLLSLFGKAEVKLAIEHLTGEVTEADLRRLYPELPLACAEQATPYGDRLCSVEIGAFNQIPSRALVLYLEGERLRAVKVDYRPRYHDLLQQQLAGRLDKLGIRGEPRDRALAWKVEGGVLLMPASEPKTDGEAALMWVSADALRGAAPAGG